MDLNFKLRLTFWWAAAKLKSTKIIGENSPQYEDTQIIKEDCCAFYWPNVSPQPSLHFESAMSYNHL